MRRYWTDEENELLKKFFPEIGKTITMEDLQKLLNRSVDSIRNHANMLNLKSGYHGSNINIDFLKDLERKIEI